MPAPLGESVTVFQTQIPAGVPGAGELRRRLLVRTLFEVLDGETGLIPSGVAISRVAQRVPLNDVEESLNNSGIPRFETTLRFCSGWAKALGWMTKNRSGWAITDAGRQALARYDQDELYAELSRGYRRLRAEQGTSAVGEDARHQALLEALTAVSEGSWTTIGDLSDFSRLSHESVARLLASDRVTNAHRVLTETGRSRFGDGETAAAQRRQLDAEGVDFLPTGGADPAQRVTSEVLAEVVGVPATGARAWLVRGTAVTGVNVVHQWLDQGFVSVPASRLRLLHPGDPLDSIRSAVEADYSHLSYNQRQAKTAELHAFLNRMSVGDAVVAPSEGRVHVGRIVGDVSYAERDDTRTTIRRPVEWSDSPIDFAALPDIIQSRLRASATVADLTEVVDAVDALFTSTEAAAAQPIARTVSVRDLPDAVAEKLLVGREWLDEFVDLVRTRRQVILYGPPGTGKTFLALEVAQAITDPSNVSLVQFHPAYSYEDFFEGYRPATVDDTGRVGFALTPGPFRKLVDRAEDDPGTPYVLIIDEINRANLAKVFGELYFLLEYRDRGIELMYSSGDTSSSGQGRDFRLPPNVFLIGTMNTADRSIALVDTAMRRRFGFLSLHPDDVHLHGVLRRWLERHDLPTEAADLLELLNERIDDRDARVGPAYFMRKDELRTGRGLERIWRTSILPLLEEHHVGDGVDVNRRYGLAALRAVLARRGRDDAADRPDAREPVGEAGGDEPVGDGPDGA